MYMICTDGASKGNPGPGGWGAVIASGDSVQELGGAKTLTTNNEMELMAAFEALSVIPEGEQIDIYTDSRYVVNGATQWISGWQKRGWKTASKTDVLYRELWEGLNEMMITRTVRWHHVPGHSGIPGNERADRIASAFGEGNTPELFNGKKSSYPVTIDSIAYDSAKKESKSRSKAQAYSYVSAVDGKVKVHTTWKECEDRVKGVPKARFKKSLDAADEKRIIDAFSK